MICTFWTPFQAERDWKKFIPRDSFNSPLIYILFSMFLNQFSFFTLIRKWVFATNYAFLTLLSSQPNVVDIRYIKLRILYLYEVSKIEISKAYIISLQRYRDEKIWVCGKDSIPLRKISDLMEQYTWFKIFQRYFYYLKRG